MIYAHALDHNVLLIPLLSPGCLLVPFHTHPACSAACKQTIETAVQAAWPCNTSKDHTKHIATIKLQPAKPIPRLQHGRLMLSHHTRKKALLSFVLTAATKKFRAQR